MEKSVSIDQKISNRIICIFAAVILGVGSFWSFISTFGLSYGFGTCLKGGPIGGLVKTVNDIGDTLGNSDYILLNQYQGEGTESGLFLSLILILCVVISYLVIKSNNRKLYLIYFLPLIAVNMIFSVETSYMAVLVMACGALIGWISSLNGEHVSPWNLTMISVLLVIVLGVSSLDVVKTAVVNLDFSNKAGKLISEVIMEARYGSNPLNNGDLSEGKRSSSDETALEVTMTNPQSLYLRGYVGESYSGSQWSQLQSATYYQSKNLIDTLNSEGFNGLGQIGTTAALGNVNVGDNNVSIKVEEASTEYGYIPYEIQGDIDGFKNWGNSFLTSSGLMGEDSYQYATTSNLTGKWTEIAGAFFSSPNTEEISQYNLYESYNNVDVYSKYTKLDDNVILTLSEEIGTRGNQEKGHIDYKTALNLVKSFFDDNIVYSENRTRGEDENYLEYFFKYKKGYDVDYATVATLMFRYYGIPARYVEGYLVTKDDLSKMEADVAYEIPLSNAHAWTEIYVDTVGWVPVEVCSNYYGVMEDADLTKGLENNNNINPFDQQESSVLGQETTNESDEGGNSLNIILILEIIGIVILGLLLAILVSTFTRYLLYRIKLRKSFNQENVKMAICAIYQYSVNRDISLDEFGRTLGLEASYSEHSFSEGDRRYLLEKLKEGEKKKHVEKKRKIINSIVSAPSSFSVDKLRKRTARKSAK